jgi:hypothetical protein
MLRKILSPLPIVPKFELTKHSGESFSKDTEIKAGQQKPESWRNDNKQQCQIRHKIAIVKAVKLRGVYESCVLGII